MSYRAYVRPGREGARPLTAQGAVDRAPVPPALVIEHVERRGRLSVAFRLLLVLPQFVVLSVLWLVGFVVVVAGWFAALVLGRLPEPIARYLCHLTRYTTRVYAYGWLLTDRYPPFRFLAEDYPVQVDLAPGRLNRLAVLFRLFLAIPAAILSGLAIAGWQVAAFFIWLLVLVLGRVPGPLFDATTAVLRYSTRLNAYALLVTAAYPWGLFGDRHATPGPPEPALGPGPVDVPEAAEPGAATLAGPAERPAPPRTPLGLLVLSGGAIALVVLFVVLGVAQGVANRLVGGGWAATITVGHHARSVDRTAVEDTIARSLQRDLPDLRVDSVACPKGIRLAEGASFQCTADVEGAQLPITVTLTHVNTSTGDYSYEAKPAKALIDTYKLVNEIHSTLPVEAANATVDCVPPRWRVVEVGGAIECTVSQGSTRQVVHAVIDDVNGTGHLEPATVWPVRPKVATGKIGDKLTVYDESGDAQLEVTVTQLKFTAGDEFVQPQHGLFMGAYVTVHALADAQTIPEIYALVGGQQYSGDAVTASTAFDPYLASYAPLNTGERAAGWLVFDVPARHGQLVMRDLDGHTVGIWKY